MASKSYFKKRWVVLISTLLVASIAICQAPFKRTGQVFLVLSGSNVMVEMAVNPSNFVPDFIGSYPLPAGGLEAIGFRGTDNFLYGINPANNHLYALGVNGVFQDLGNPNLMSSAFYLAGDISKDGKELVSIGSNNANNDIHIARTSLENSNYSTSIISMNSGTSMADIAFDPFTDKLYGYDKNNRSLVEINKSTGTVSFINQIKIENQIGGLYFDVFGQLYGYGSTAFGIVDAVFSIDKNTGKETLLSTGPKNMIADAASCLFSVEVKNSVNPLVALPCSEVIYSYTLANGSDEIITGLNFSQELPSGFYLTQVIGNPFGVSIDTVSEPGAIHMKNLTLHPGLKVLTFKVYVGDLPKNTYKSQATLQNLPSLYGLLTLSDNAITPGFEDSTSLKINRFEEDSLNFEWFICHGESLVLDASEYGNNIKWNTGSTSQLFEVSQGGIYQLEAGSTCEAIIVRHEVTSASCPFTISLLHTVEPDTIYGCGTTLLRFILKNNSGEDRTNVSFTDTLPNGLKVQEIVNNPFGGTIDTALLPEVIHIAGILLKSGSDTLDILVSASDEMKPGMHGNQAKLHNLPKLMGPIRLSDDPSTMPADSSTFHIVGFLDDTLYFDTILCLNEELVLDASGYGDTYLWNNGSTTSTFRVENEGIHEVNLLSSCKPSKVYWDVKLGEQITVTEMTPISIHQGEEVVLSPKILNQSDKLFIHWIDAIGNTLSCTTCLNPSANPLFNTFYTLITTNTSCSDTATLELLVDETRRIYAPNSFSPNSDGINDYFFLQSPDPGIIRSLNIVDRWGKAIYHAENILFNIETSGWDGSNIDQKLQSGVYLWWAAVEFIDGKKAIYKGDIVIMK